MTCINGVLLNNIKLDHKGAYTVQGVQSGYIAKMKLHATGMLTSKAKMHEARPAAQGAGTQLVLIHDVLAAEVLNVDLISANSCSRIRGVITTPRPRAFHELLPFCRSGL